MRLFATTAAVVTAGLLGLSVTATSWGQADQNGGEQQGQQEAAQGQQQSVEGQLVFLHTFVTGQPLVEKGGQAKLMGPPVLAIHTQDGKVVILNVAKLRHAAQARRQQERQQMGVTPQEQWQTIKERAHKFIDQQVKAEGTMYSKAGIEYLIADSLTPTKAAAEAPGAGGAAQEGGS